MKMRFLSILLCTIMLGTAMACNSAENAVEDASARSSEQTSEEVPVPTAADDNNSTNNAEDHGHVHNPSTGETIELDEYTVELTLPAEYIGDATQEQLTQTASELGYKSITLNADGSATYIMTEAQHEVMLGDMRNSLKQAVAQMIGSTDYPSFSNVTVDDDFTKFMITTINASCTSEEDQAVLTLIMYSGIYHIFKGEAAESVRVDVVNIDSNDIIYYYDSAEAQSGN